MGTIVDLIGAPLSAAEVTLAVILASVTRAITVSYTHLPLPTKA